MKVYLVTPEQFAEAAPVAVFFSRKAADQFAARFEYPVTVSTQVAADGEHFPPPVEETCWACGRVVVFPRQEAAWEAGCAECGRHVCSDCADDEGLCPCERCDVCGSTDICCSDGHDGDWALCKKHCDVDHTPRRYPPGDVDHTLK